MIKQKTYDKIEELKKQGVNIINYRQIYSNNKQRVILTVLCTKCNRRFDIRLDTMSHQKYRGLCTSCAHWEGQRYKAQAVEDIIMRFESEGYKVLTPKEKIKPKGNRTVYFTNVDIQNKYGDVYTTNCNNFFSRIDYYRELANCDAKNEMLKNESRLEYKVRKFLIEQDIPHKQQFRFMDCRGEKYPLPFDFCLYYTTDKKLLIEVDGEQHFRKGGLFANKFEQTQKNDRRKNYYCNKNNIPLLRLNTNDIDGKKEIYKQKILDFISNNR